MKFLWSNKVGYQVSTAGDKRFSALNARMPDGRTIEMHYQCDVKGYDVGGRNWRLGKGKPPRTKMTPEQLYEAYLALWVTWAANHPHYMQDLRSKAIEHDYMLCDFFAHTPINQARALADILNETV